MSFAKHLINKKALKRIFYIYAPFALIVYGVLWITGLMATPMDMRKLDPVADFSNNTPIVYSDYYNIEFFGLEKYHPFDSVKYRHVYEALLQKFPDLQRTHIPASVITPPYLALAHSPDYLASLESSWTLAKITELGFLRFFPSNLAHNLVLEPMMYQMGGSLLAGVAALQHGWAINLGGGFHHASYDNGEGFCPLADISLVVKYLRAEHKIKRAMIIDLDAHQGNGHGTDFGDDPDTFILDAYNDEIYPHDEQAKRGIDAAIPLAAFTSDTEFFAKIEPKISSAIDDFKPDIIIYVAGTDILDGDPLGALSISRAGIIKRDEMVFRAALERKIPVVMLFGGGYQKSNAEIIAASIENLAQKFYLFKSKDD